MKNFRKVVIESPKARDWKAVGDESVMAKKFGLALVSQKFTTPDGGEEEFVFCRKAPGVTVLTITGEGNLVLVGQYKHGRKLFVWEAPAGMVWEGDNFEEQALTEMTNETGYRGEKIQLLCTTSSCAGPRKNDTAEWLYVVTGARHVGSQKLDKNEQIAVMEVSPDVFVEMCEGGEIISSGTREAFLWAVLKGYIGA